MQKFSYIVINGEQKVHKCTFLKIEKTDLPLFKLSVQKHNESKSDQ